MTDILVSPYNEVYDHISTTDDGVYQEIADQFTYFAKNYKYHPKYKSRVWDGKIRLFSPRKPLLYCGLREDLQKFADAREYTVHYDVDQTDTEFSIHEAHEFIDSLNLPIELNGLPFEKKRDVQVDAFVHAIRKKRIVLKSPTSSGKSYIIYLIQEWIAGQTLIIVPRLGLVDQMYGDFRDYGMDVERDAHRIYSGQEKRTEKRLIISTWQSLQNMEPEYFDQFDAVIVDEVHQAAALKLKGILESMKKCKWRIGTTGTLSGDPLDEKTITGLFGPIYQVTTNKEMIAAGRSADFKIKALVLSHPEDARKALKKAKGDYQTEIDYICASDRRNNFIKNLALSLKGNTVILFRYVEKHGEVLKELIEREAQIPVLYVSGKVDREDRETIRKFVNEQENSLTLASVGTFALGTNIPNIHNLIFVSPAKSLIETLQKIGRALRKSGTKDSAVLYDIADDISWKSWTNHTMNHFSERVSIYSKEEFPYKIYKIDLA